MLSGSLLFTGCGGASSALSALPGVTSSRSSATAATGHATRLNAKAQSAVADYDTTILADSPVSYYEMNDATPLLHDAGAGALNGTYGSAVTQGVPGLTSMNYTAAAFPGGTFDPTRIASVLPNAQLQPTIVSVETWVNASALNTSNHYQPIVAYGRFSTGTPYHLSISPINQFFFSVHTATGSPSVVARTASSAGRTFHVVGTYDGSTLSMYVNGVLEQQKAATGAITYVGLYPTTGLAIGSGFDALATHPLANYAGTIANVSVYNYALTSAQVMNHYLSGVKTPPLTETPVAADKFVDSIGVNASFNYQSTVYDTKYSSLKSLLIASGIRHIRTGMAQTTWQTYYDRLNELGRAGVHSQVVTQGTETAAQIQAFPALVSQSIEAFEGPNEPDLSGDPNWLSNTQAFMQVLYTAVKGNAATANFPVIGPSVVNPGNITAIGNLSADMDYGNIHPYYGTNNPGNTGTGSISQFGRSGSIAYYQAVAAQLSGTKPLFATETGYGTDPAISGNVSELCDGKEAPRTYFEHFKHGIARTLPYQLVESGAAYGALGFFSYMGLLHQDLTPKPSYTAIKALNTLLADPGTALTTAPLSYVIRGNVNNLEHLLMEKRNGTYYLAMWIEVPSWNATTGTDLTAPSQSVTIDMPLTTTGSTLYSLNDAGAMTSAALTANAGSVTVPVTDRVTVLAFHP